MDDFLDRMDSLKKTMDQIADSIRTITGAIEEGAKGVNGAAESTQTLVVDMEVISERMRQNHNIAKSLEAGTAIFEKF